MFASASKNPITRLWLCVWDRLRPRKRGAGDSPSDKGSGPCGAALGALALTLLLASGVQAAEVTFQYRPGAPAQSVTVAGSFNGWDMGANALADADGDGLWTGTVDLPDGRHEYKFVVNGSEWITDESAPDFADDGFGGKNSVVQVAGNAMQVGGALEAPPAPAVTAPPVPAGTAAVTFRFRPSGGAGSVSVAGSFNGWDVNANPMKDAGGVWEATIPLAPGSHQYKFVVDGTQWITDESAPAFEEDGFGGKNSVVNVGDAPLAVGEPGAAAATPAAPAAPASDGTYPVTFRYQPVIGGVGSVSVAGSFNEWNAAANPLADGDDDGIWEAVVPLAPGSHQYKFVVDGDQWLADDHAMDSAPDGFGGENSVVTVTNAAIILGPGGNAPAKAEAAPLGLHKVTFRHRPSGTPQQLVLAGSFNDWNVGKSPLGDADGDGEYTVTLLLPAGEYQYKFVADGNWITDRAHADSFVEDGFGGENSVVLVDGRFPAVEVKLGDGEISDAGIEHTQTATEVNNMGGGMVELTFKSHRNDIEAMSLIVSDEAGERTIPAASVGSDGAFAYWRAVVELPSESASFRYVPVYRDAGAAAHLTPAGFSEALPSPDARFAFTPDRFPPFLTPDWVRDAVIYQIFPDRFKNGDAANDPDFSEWYYEGKNALPASGKTNEEYFHLVSDWSDVGGLIKSPYRTDGKPDYFSFYGGDLEGVRQELDYLADLGVTAIYFNPLFKAKSNHKYDCADFMLMDPHLGTNDEFKAFVAEAHGKGIRVILDIVFNHSGSGHWAFKEAVEKGPESPYYEWFEFKRWPLPNGFPAGGPKPEDYYACWWGFGDLPDLNFDLSRPNPSENAVKTMAEAQVNQPLFDHLLGVVEFWVGDMDADGVRLDVPNEVPSWFWDEFNRKVKGIKTDAYIVGELWGNASDWVGPTLFDATMNYAYFRDPVTKFLGQGRGSAAEFDRTLASGRNAYPTQATQAMMNLLGSHDTVRYRQQVGGDVNRLKLSYLFGMTYVGAPHIYYGDEIAMMGGKDPDCRRPFLWDWAGDAQRADVHGYVRSLARARAEHAALRRGAFTSVFAQGTSYAYLRTLGEERILVALNTASRTGVLDLDLAALGNPASAVNLVTGETVDLSGPLSLPPVSGVALRLN